MKHFTKYYYFREVMNNDKDIKKSERGHES